MPHCDPGILSYVVYVQMQGTVSAVNCRFGNFSENFIFANSIKIHISDVKNLRLRQDLSIPINGIVILPFREGFNFTKLRICEVSRK